MVSIHPYFKVHAGKLEEFRAMLPAFAEKTSSEKDCLFYDFTSHGDEFLCREAYRNAEAALHHLANVGDLLSELMKVADLARLEIHGPALELEKLKGPLADYQPAWFVREGGLER